MILIEGVVYSAVAQSLIEEIGIGEFYKGIIEYDSEELSLSLNLTLIIYRESDGDLTDKFNKCGRITKIIPVWWQCTTVQECGEVRNTFSWREFYEFLQF